MHERVGDLLGIAPDQVHDDTELPDDALALVELLEGIEEDLGERTVGISDDESEDWVYVRDVVASVTNLLAQ